MRLRAPAAVLLLTSACAAPTAPVTARTVVVRCAGRPASGDASALGRRIGFVGEGLVVAGEAHGPFAMGGVGGAAASHCPAAPSVLVMGLAPSGAPSFTWCIASPAPFPALATTADGFVVAGRFTRDAAPERLAAGGAPSPAGGAEELSVLRFSASGAFRGKSIVARGAGVISAVAALPDGALVIEGSLAHLPPAPLGAEHFLARVAVDGGVTDLEPRRTTELGATPVVLLPRAAGGVFRVAADGAAIDVQTVNAAGARDTRARIAAEGPVVDLAAAFGSDDDVWLAWSSRQGRGEPVRYRRVLARAGANRTVNERSLGREDLDAHVEAVVPLASDRAAVLFRIAKGARQEARFGKLALPEKRAVTSAVLAAYEVPGTDEVALATFGDDAVGLGAASQLDVVGDAKVALTGWFRGALRAWGNEPSSTADCGLFVGRLEIENPEARLRRPLQ